MSLYQRFCQLDRNSCGFISADEFMTVPEFAVNPLSQVYFTSILRLKGYIGFGVFLLSVLQLF